MEHRVLDRPMITFSLRDEIAKIKAGPQWAASGKTAITLARSDRLRIVLALLGRGKSLEEHAAEGAITVNVVEGAIRFITPDERVELSAGALLSLHGGIRHSVEALEDSAFVITLAA